MPLSRLIGYYCLMLLLSSVIFARWLPALPSSPDPAQGMASADAPAARPAPLLVSMRVTDNGLWAANR